MTLLGFADMRPGRPTEVEYLIIGAGAGGLQLGYFLERAGRDYLIFEAADAPGAFWRRYPRGRELISFNKVHSIYDDPELRLRWDWNSLLTDGYDLQFREYSQKLYPSADEMLAYLAAFADRYALKISYETRVVRVAKDDGGAFDVELADGGHLSCRCLIVATGVGERPYVPDIPGIEFAEGYEDVSLEPAHYAGERVFVLGKGNSGFEFADAIIDTAALVHLASPRSIRFAWKTRHPGHVRGQYTRVLDMYQLKTLNGALDCHVLGIRAEGGDYTVRVGYVHADGEIEEITYDRVVRCTGFRFDDSIFDHSCRPALAIDGRLPAITGGWESTNVDNLFFAGTLMQTRDFKRASSAFVDGFRYNVRTLHAMLEARREGRPLPSRTLEATPAALTAAILERVSRASSLWAQFGYLCDVITVDEEAGTAAAREDLPLDLVREGGFDRPSHFYTVSLEWGSWDGDVFAIERHPNHEAAHTNVFLHPIVRRYDGLVQVDVHHVLEDLLGMYRIEGESGVVRERSGRELERYHLEEHVEPLLAFFVRQLERAPVLRSEEPEATDA